MFKGKPKIYFGDGGFRGMSEIRRSGSVNSRPSIRKSPSVYMGGGMSVGVSARSVLASGGIVGGGMVGVGGGVPSPRVVTKPKPEKRLEEFSKAMAEKEMELIEADAKAEKFGEAEVRKNMMEMAREPNLAAAMEELPKYTEFSMNERGNGCNEKMTEKEERLADFLEAAQDAKAKCEETDAPPTVEPTSAAVLPELPLGEAVPAEGKRKRKRRRKHQRADASLNFE